MQETHEHGTGPCGGYAGGLLACGLPLVRTTIQKQKLQECEYEIQWAEIPDAGVKSFFTLWEKNMGFKAGDIVRNTRINEISKMAMRPTTTAIVFLLISCSIISAEPASGISEEAILRAENRMLRSQIDSQAKEIAALKAQLGQGGAGTGTPTSQPTSRPTSRPTVTLSPKVVAVSPQVVRPARTTTLGAGTFTGGKDVPVGLYDVTPGAGQSGNFVVWGTDDELIANETLGNARFCVPKVRVQISDGDKIKISSLSSVTFTPIKE